MKIEYKPIEKLESIAVEALSEIKREEHCENFLLAYQLTISNLINNQIIDATQQARDWASESCPEHLFFNHGQYRKKGLEHLIEELKSKPTSNRAIYSLLNQDDISGSGDKPIPSFMLFQCLLDEDNKELCCTVYFRALEISNFLRINLEEIRQNIEKIHKSGINFNSVKLLIIAGRAHHTPTSIPLNKPKLDLMTPAELHLMLIKKPTELAPLLRDKASIQTVINYDSFENIKDALKVLRNEIPNYKPVMLSMIEDIIELSKELKEVREKYSHSARVVEKSRKIADLLEELALEFSK